MKRSWARIVGITACVLISLLIPSCGADNVLTAISVSPQGSVLIGPGVQVQFMAIGTYIHPPATKDVTDIVNWSSNSPQIVTINSKGLATSTTGCGTNLGIIATYYTNPSNPSAGNVVVGNATISVETVAGTCP